MSGSARPLQGKRVLVCRAARESVDLFAGLSMLGASVSAQAIVRTLPTLSPAALEAAALRWVQGDYDWLVFTSANGVQTFADAVSAARRMVSKQSESSAGPGDPSPQNLQPLQPLQPSRIAAVGPATAAALNKRGYTVDLLPDATYSGNGLADALIAHIAPAVTGRHSRPTRVLLPVSDIASTTIETALTAAKVEVDRVTAYRTVPVDLPAESPGNVIGALAAGTLEDNKPDAILVLSSSGARALVHLAGHALAGIKIVAIGEPTAATLTALGHPPAQTASPHSTQGLIDATVAALTAEA